MFAVAALAGFMGMVYGDKTYYTAHAVLFIAMAMMLFSTRNRNLKRAEVKAPE